MKMFSLSRVRFAGLGVLAGLALATLPAHSSTLFTANLAGSVENPPNATTGTGFGTLLLNDAEDSITVNESFTGLTGPATASHIHLSTTLGTNGPVVFPFAGVPAATSGSIPEQSFAINATQVAQLKAGLGYFNVHTARFPGGEIRGIINASTVPEPGVLSLLLGAAPVAVVARRRRAR